MRKFKLDKRPLIWFHYAILVGILFGAYYIGDALVDLSNKANIFMFIWFYAFVAFGDQLIHYVLNVD